MGYLSDLLNNPPQDRDACWLWPGGLQANGYPNGGGLPIELAVMMGKLDASPYRVTYRVLRGPIPAGLDLDHLCFTPACVNPWHLEPVTRQENIRRRRKFGNVRRLPSGRYQARYTADRLRHSATFATENEARAWLESHRG